MKKINKQYISAIDKELSLFDQNHLKSPSQQAEFDKYQQVYEKRDRGYSRSREKDRRTNAD